MIDATECLDILIKLRRILSNREPIRITVTPKFHSKILKENERISCKINTPCKGMLGQFAGTPYFVGDKIEVI